MTPVDVLRPAAMVIGAPGRIRYPILAVWTYERRHPLVVGLHLHQRVNGAPGWVTWELSRDLLHVAVSGRPVGGGDVWMWPSADRAELLIGLCSPSGQCVLGVSMDAAREVLAATEAVVESYGPVEAARVGEALDGWLDAALRRGA